MARRVLVLLRARLASKGPGGGLPVAAWLSQALLAGVVCGLVRDSVPPFAYALVALSVCGALVAIPLLGELGYLLRADPASAWVTALPVTALELKLARTLHVLVALAVLALGSLVPAAVLAPGEFGLFGRLGLFLDGLGMVFALASVLLLAQSVLGGRAESLLVLVQTLLVIGVVVGLGLGLRQIPLLQDVDSLAAGGSVLQAYPVSWFAAPWSAGGGLLAVAAPAVLTALALLLLAVIPPPAEVVARRSAGWLERLLAPLRLAATRLWVRRDERGVFDLVYDALPREREVVLRTVPLLGIPLAFLFAAASGEPGPRRDALLAVLLFTPGTYLPVLLTQVPVSSSPRARWILETAPVPPAAVESGTVKALAVRFVLPLYLLLGVLGWQQGGLELTLRLALPGALVSLYVLRALYPMCVTAPPLSTLPDEVRSDLDWGNVLVVLAVALTVVAIAAVKYIDSYPRAGLAVAGLLVLVALQDRRLRTRVPAEAGP